MELSKKEGFLRYDPIPIIEGLAIGFSQASLNEPENQPLRSYARALHEAYITVLKKGIAPPDLAPKLKSKQKTGVDTASFVKELLTFLGLKEEAAAQMLELRQTLKEIR